MLNNMNTSWILKANASIAKNESELKVLSETNKARYLINAKRKKDNETDPNKIYIMNHLLSHNISDFKYI